MSDKAGIPSWQRAQAPSSPPDSTEQQPEEQAKSVPEADTAESTTDNTQPESTSLLDQASKFLEDPAIRDAPREKKVAFLQSKGVKTEDVDKLLATTTGQGTTPALTKDRGPVWPTTPPTSQSTPQNIPPIITYPEFLVEPIKPPPLITTERLLTTAYITGGLMATMYGLSKYLIAPMVQNLSSARHEFASHTQEKLVELNTKLLDIASEDPADKKSVIAEIVDDISEADSDPTELFHRDVGTQTTPMLSRRESAGPPDSDSDKSVVGSHERRLKILTSHLKELEVNRSASTESSNSLRTKLSDLQTYLTEMSYQNNYYSSLNGLYGGTYGLPKSKDGKDDRVEAFKADIRSVKGIFLSARNFPAAGAGNFGA